MNLKQLTLNHGFSIQLMLMYLYIHAVYVHTGVYMYFILHCIECMGACFGARFTYLAFSLIRQHYWEQINENIVNI